MASAIEEIKRDISHFIIEDFDVDIYIYEMRRNGYLEDEIVSELTDVLSILNDDALPMKVRGEFIRDKFILLKSMTSYY